MELEGILKRKVGTELTFEVNSDQPIPYYYKDNNGQVKTVIQVIDPRMITKDQHGYIFGLFNDISDYTGYPVDYVKELMKNLFCIHMGWDNFSLAYNKISQYNAGWFIEFMIEFCFEQEIPFLHKEFYIGNEHTKILFLYLKYRRCFISGEKGEVAHYEAVGMGRNRRKIDHSKHRFWCLSRKYHDEQHRIGVVEFMKKYKIVPIKLTPEQIKEFKIGG